MLTPVAQPAAQTVKAQPPAVPPYVAVKAKALSLLAGGTSTDWNVLRAELRTALAASEKRYGRLHPLPLTLRALIGLVLDKQGEDRGLRLFAESCGSLFRQLRLTQRVHGQEARETLPFLDAFQELYGLEKLKADRWEDLALRVGSRHSRGPRPDLEGRVVAAIERHYGGFLSFRSPDRGAVLEDVSLLLALWSRRTQPPGATREFVEVALRSSARGVWKLVSVHSDEALREHLKTLISSLDPNILQEEMSSFLPWLTAQSSSPWKDDARTLAVTMDSMLAKSDRPPAVVLQRRVRLARALGENERAIRMISTALRESQEDRSPVLALAEEQLRDNQDAALGRLLHESLLADLPRVSADTGGRALLAADAQRLENGGDFGSAEVLWRSLFDQPRTAESEGGPMAPGALEHALGSNLAAQHRWEEARFFLEAITAFEKWRGDPSLRFQLAAVEAGRGDTIAARRWARGGFALLPVEEPVKPVSGLAAALRIALGDPQEGPVQEILDRVRTALDPEERVPALKDPAILLALVEGLEQRNAIPSVVRDPACPGPWSAIGEDPLTRGMALLQAANGLRLQDAEPCLREALRLLEQAFGEQDPRLLQPLMRLARCLQDREDPAAEAVFRRLLALAAAHPEVDSLLESEARARLGQFLSEQGRDVEADTLLREALDRLLKESPSDPKRLEMLGGVVLMLVARSEYLEDYFDASQVLEQVESLLAKDAPDSGKEIRMESELRELTGPKVGFIRRARLRTLLQAQGLP
jgi:tetratricopeptide (TPR) repeat protein